MQTLGTTWVSLIFFINNYFWGIISMTRRGWFWTNHTMKSTLLIFFKSERVIPNSLVPFAASFPSRVILVSLIFHYVTNFQYFIIFVVFPWTVSSNSFHEIKWLSGVIYQLKLLTFELIMRKKQHKANKFKDVVLGKSNLYPSSQFLCFTQALLPM